MYSLHSGSKSCKHACMYVSDPSLICKLICNCVLCDFLETTQKDSYQPSSVPTGLRIATELGRP